MQKVANCRFQAVLTHFKIHYLYPYDNVMNAIQTVKEEQVKSQDEVRQLIEASATKLESINKIIFINICISVTTVIMIGVLFLIFKG